MADSRPATVEVLMLRPSMSENCLLARSKLGRGKSSTIPGTDQLTHGIPSGGGGEGVRGAVSHWQVRPMMLAFG